MHRSASCLLSLLAIGCISPGFAQLTVTGGRINGEPVAPITELNAQLEDLPRDYTPIAGKHLHGLETQESDAIVHLYHFAREPIIFSRLSASDRQVFTTSSDELKRRNAGLRSAGDTLCRRALAVTSAEDTAAVEQLGQLLAGLDTAERQLTIETYRALLEKLTEEGAALIEREKHRIHSRLSSFETDFVKQSQEEPEWLLRNILAGCSR